MAPRVIRSGQTFSFMAQLIRVNGVRRGDITACIYHNQKLIAKVNRNLRLNRFGRQVDIPVPEGLMPGEYSLNVMGTGGAIFNFTQSLMMVAKTKSLFIQTEKSLYKAGEKVRFRVLSFLPNFKPYNGEVNISVYDCDENQVYHWRENAGSYGVIEREFNLTSSANNYLKIKAKAGSVKTSKKINVINMDDSSMAKLYVKVMAPSFTLKTGTGVSFKVKAKTMDEKPFSGYVNVTVTLKHMKMNEKDFFNLVDKIDGEKSFRIPLPGQSLLGQANSLDGCKLAIKVMVKDILSNQAVTEHVTVPIHARQTNLKFPTYDAEYFKPGLPYRIHLEAFQPDGRPMNVENVEVIIKASTAMQEEAGDEYEFHRRTVSIHDTGYAVFSFDTPMNASCITIKAKLGEYEVSRQINKTYSPTNTFMQVSLMNTTVLKPGDRLAFKIQLNRPLKGRFVLQIFSRGKLVSVLNRRHFTRSTMAMVSFNATGEMGPNTRLVAYIIHRNNEIIADSIGFNILKVFPNEVSLNLNATNARFGDEVEYTVRAHSGSKAFLIAFDQRFKCKLPMSKNDITPADVYSDLPEYDGTQGHSDMRRFVLTPYPISYTGNSVSETLHKSGVIVLTSAQVPAKDPSMNQAANMMNMGDMMNMTDMMDMADMMDMMDMMDMTDMMDMMKMMGMKAMPMKKMKSPESWIWKKLQIGESGETKYTATVPDEMTSWVANAFAVHSEKGFGISPRTSMLDVEKSFYLNLKIPKAVVRGEKVVIEAWVHNHLDEDQNVMVKLPRSLSYHSIHINCDGTATVHYADEVMNVMVKAGESSAVRFPIIPRVLKHINIDVTAKSAMAGDFIRRQIDVKAEGVALELKQSVIIDLTAEHNVFNKKLAFNVSLDSIENTSSGKVTLHGVRLPPRLGFHNIRVFPRNDGEEVIVNLALNAYLSGYIEKTGQMTEDFNSQLISQLRAGVETEIRLQHDDGSFSINGEELEGSIWFSAFVARIFREASTKIELPEDVLRFALQWIISQQSDNGSFAEQSPMNNQTMQGGSGVGPALTATVVIALAVNKDMFANDTEEGRLYYKAMVKALGHLEYEVDHSNDSYLMGLSAYAFHMAGSDKADEVMNRLNESAITEGNTRHWHVEQGAGTDMEATSYITLTLALRGHIGSSLWSLRYLLEHSDPNASQLNMQEKILFYQLLEQFVGVLRNDELNIDAMITFDDEVYEFNINNENADMMQQRLSSSSPSEISIFATGKGVAILELSSSSNARQVLENSFNLDATVRMGMLDEYHLDVCVSLKNESLPRTLVVVIGILSGFEVHGSNLETDEDGNVVMTLTSVSREETCTTLKSRRSHKVAMLKPAVIRAFDPTDPSTHASAMYSYEKVETSSVLSVCSECMPMC